MNSKYTQFTSQNNLPGINATINVISRCSLLPDDGALRFVVNTPLFGPYGVCIVKIPLCQNSGLLKKKGGWVCSWRTGVSLNTTFVRLTTNAGR